MARRAALVRVATLLVSGDLAKAEDVVQTALTRLYLAWPRVRLDTVDAYARRRYGARRSGAVRNLRKGGEALGRTDQ